MNKTINDAVEIYKAMKYIVPQMSADIYNRELSLKKRKQRMQFVHAADEFMLEKEQYINQINNDSRDFFVSNELIEKFQKWIDTYNAIDL